MTNSAYSFNIPSTKRQVPLNVDVIAKHQGVHPPRLAACKVGSLPARSDENTQWQDYVTTNLAVITRAGKTGRPG